MRCPCPASVKPEWNDHFKLTTGASLVSLIDTTEAAADEDDCALPGFTEDYLHSVVTLVNELVRFKQQQQVWPVLAKRGACNRVQ